MSERPLTDVILNPAASGGAGARLRPRVEAWLEQRGIPFSLTATEAPGHARELARVSCGGGAGRIVVVGGDGTIHEVANGLLDPELDGAPPPLAVVPVGTGNDFYRMVSPSRSWEGALETLDRGEVRRFDVGRVRFGEGGCYFVNLLGVGVDVEVLQRREGFRRLRGLPQYLAALVTALAGFHPEAFRVSLGDSGESIVERILLAAVTVGPSAGGGFLLSPGASPEDGELDLFVAPPLSIGKLMRYIPRVIRGTHADLPEVHMRRLVRARLERPDGEPFFFEVDGERMPQPVTSLEIEVVPGRLPVLVPRRSE